MSTVNSSIDTIDELMKTVEDGVNGFELCVEKLEGAQRKDVSDLFRTLGSQRAEFRDELRSLARNLGHVTNDKGTVAAKIQREWMDIQDFVSETDAKRVLNAAESGERHAIGVFVNALEKNLTPDLRTFVAFQLESIRSSHEKIRKLAMVENQQG
jgi:uncharacterized protein (TIGR02284 family)